MRLTVKDIQDWTGLVLVVLLVSLSGCGQEGQSELVGLFIQQPAVDLGELEPVAVIHTTITVRNQSDKSVELTQIKLGCYCMDSDFVPTELGPHQDYKCEISINDPIEGVSVQKGQFLTDELGDVEPAFSIRYHVKPRAYLLPSVVYLGELYGDAVSWPIQKDLEIDDFAGSCEFTGAITVSPANTSNYSCPLEYSITAISKRFESGSTLQLTIIKKEGCVGGIFHDKLLVHIPSSGGEISLSLIVSGVYH